MYLNKKYIKELILIRVYSSQNLKWIKKVNQICPKTRTGIVLILGQLWWKVLIHFKCWLLYTGYKVISSKMFKVMFTKIQIKLADEFCGSSLYVRVIHHVLPEPFSHLLMTFHSKMKRISCEETCASFVIPTSEVLLGNISQDIMTSVPSRTF